MAAKLTWLMDAQDQVFAAAQVLLGFARAGLLCTVYFQTC